MKKVFFIVGPESSGTRIVTRLFCLAGCWGDWSHEQRLDRFVYGKVSKIPDLAEESEAIVFRRSIPHYPVVRPDIVGIGDMFLSVGFQPYYIVTMRNWGCNAASKERVGHSPDLSKAKQDLTEEWVNIGNLFGGFGGRFYVILTSSLFRDPQRAINDMGTWLKLKFPPQATEVVFDADEKYY